MMTSTCPLVPEGKDRLPVQPNPDVSGVGVNYSGGRLFA